MIFLELPDSEAAVASALRDALDPVGVFSSIPKDPTYPLLLVSRIGGVPAERHTLDLARIQVGVWGNSKSEAHDLAQLARVVILEMEGQMFHDPVDIFVSGVDDGTGIHWLPDQPTGRDRYVFDMRLWTRPAEPLGS